MKTKLSKKLLSAFLAVLMIVTSLPIVSISAFAADDAAVTEVKDAMKAFEDKLESEGSFTNVTPAYNAYVECQKALDAYIYGGKTDALSGKASALTTAISNIGTFTGATPDDDYIKVWTDDSTDGYSTLHKNALWVQTEYNTERFNIIPSDTMENVRIYYPEVTLLYDGKTTPTTTINAILNGGTGTTRNRYRYAYAVTLDNTDGITLSDNWRGKPSNFDTNWAWGYGENRLSYVSTGLNGASIYQVYARSTLATSATKTEHRFVNVISFTGSFDSTDTKYYKDIAPTLTLYAGSSDTTFSNNDITGSGTGEALIHVINYKALTDQLAETGSSMKSISPSDYSEGGLASYISIMEAATSFNPNDYFSSSNDYTGCASAIGTQISNLKNATSTIVADSADYQKLRDAMNETVRAVGEGENTGYTTESWGTFKEKYAVAKTIMSACNESGYVSTSAATAAEELTAAFKALETEVSKVYTTALESVISQFEGYPSSTFTAESYASVLAVVNAAKAAVWGSVEEYGVPTSAPDDSTEAQALVAQQTANINEALKNLRFSMDTVVVTTIDGRTTMNKALELKAVVDADVDAEGQTNYGNLGTFTSAYNAALVYISAAATTEFTDYDTQLAEYTAQVQAVYDAYHSLYYSFLKTPDGTIANQGVTTTMTTLTTSDTNAQQQVGFAYTNSAIIFKTTHDAIDVNYGKATITFGTNRGKGTGTDVPNNMLDSISINATAAAIAGQDSKNVISGTQKTNSSTPGALTDEQKVTYAGCLSYNGISLTNIKYTGASYTNNADQALTLNDGTTVSFTDAENYDLTDILGTTNGAASNPGQGGMFARSNDDQDAWAYIYADADMTVSIPGTAQQTLSSSTVPSLSTISITGTNFGAVTLYNTQNTTACSAYHYMTSASTGETINTTVSIVDISYLVDLVKMCNAILPDQAKYTETTWTNFETALNAAGAVLKYNTMTASAIATQCTQRYSNLWAAYDALKVKTFNVVFNYKDANGADTSTKIVAEYGKTLNDYIDQFNAIEPPTYIADNSTYTFNGNWDPSIDLTAAIKADASYTAQYDSVLNAADFTAYNTAKASLLGALTDETYTIATLQSLAESVSALTYFTYTDEQKSATMADVQSAIDAETATLQSLLNGLTASSLTYDAAKAAIEAAKTNAADIDRYDLSGLDLDDSDYKQSVVVCDEATVVGLRFGSQEEIDAYTSDILNNMQVMTYTIYLNGTAVATDVPYGTPVIIDSNGTAHIDVTDTDINNTSDIAAWKYSYCAPSREAEGKGATEPKYMTTAPSLGFIVKGDTYLTADIQDSASADTTYIVTVKASTGNIIDVATTTGSYTMPTAPNYAFYTFSGYANGANAGDVITVDKNTTIIANYTADASNTYQIDVFDSLDTWMGAVDFTTYNVSYNEKVELKGNDTYCWVSAIYTDISTYTVIAYTNDYSFYACRGYINDDGEALVALSKADYESLVKGQTSVNQYSGEVSFDNSAADVIVDGSGNPILGVAVANSSGLYDNNSLKVVQGGATVTALSDVIPIYNGDSVEKFSIIGTFTLPEGYSIVECGFLFTSDTAVADGSIVLEAVGSNGIARMKSSLYTCGNQFVVNVKNPSSSVAFKYVAYAIVKDADGNLIECYATPYQSTNNF